MESNCTIVTFFPKIHMGIYRFFLFSAFLAFPLLFGGCYKERDSSSTVFGYDANTGQRMSSSLSQEWSGDYYNPR